MSIPNIPVLPANSGPAASNTNKVVNSKPSSNGKKGSFGDKLESAISQAEADIGEAEQAPDTRITPGKLLINSFSVNLLLNGSSSDTNQLPVDGSDIISDETGIADDSTDVTTMMNNPALAGAVPLIVMSPDVQASTENGTTEQSPAPAAPLTFNETAVLPQTSVTNTEESVQPLTNQTGTFQEIVAQMLEQNQESTQQLTTNPSVASDRSLLNQTMGPLTDNQKDELSNDAAAPILPEVATAQQSQTAKTIPAANSNVVQPDTESEESTGLSQQRVVQPETNLQQGFTGNGSDDTLSGDSQTLSQSKLVQDLKVTVTESSSPQTFAQGLNAILQPATGNIANVDETAATQSTFADVHQIADQIIEQTKVITKQQNTEMVIRLKPEHLGELTLKVAVENGVVSASFHSNNAEVRNIIESSLPQLKQELSNTGLKVDNVSVYAGLSQFLPNHDQDRNSRQQFAKFTNKKSAEDFVEAIESELPDGRNSLIGNDTGVDYRI
ncbi:flagellar hook-length control protein FliK [Sporomusa aerivorans]|uniref:flagellar hook-length control protein FliK n=1 Tax=Sporomusa aerivorans TaxID=204936 RepID=UPI00352B0166